MGGRGGGVVEQRGEADLQFGHLLIEGPDRQGTGGAVAEAIEQVVVVDQPVHGPGQLVGVAGRHHQAVVPVDDHLLGAERVGAHHHQAGRQRLAGHQRVGLAHDRRQQQHVVSSQHGAELVGLVRLGRRAVVPAGPLALGQPRAQAVGGHRPAGQVHTRAAVEAIDGLDQDGRTLHVVGSTGIEEPQRIRPRRPLAALERGVVRRQPGQHLVGQAVLVEGQPPRGHAVGGQHPPGRLRGGQHQVRRLQDRGQRLAAVAAPPLIHLAGAGSSLDHQRARPHPGVHQELAGAQPPEVVHGHHHPGPGRPGRRDQPGAQGLQRVEVDHVGGRRPQVGPEVLGDRRIVPVVLVVPTDEGRGGDPVHGQTGLVGLVPGAQGLPIAQPAGVDRGLVAPGGQPPSQPLGLEGAPAGEVGGIVGRDGQDAHVATYAIGRPSRGATPLWSTGTDVPPCSRRPDPPLWRPPRPWNRWLTCPSRGTCWST